MQNYRECEYININGYNTFFDTGFLLKPNFKFVLSFMDLKGPSNYSWGCFIGNLEGDANQGFIFRVGGSARVFEVGTKTSLAQIPFKSGIVNVEGGNTYLLDLDSGNRADSNYGDFTSTKNVVIGSNFNNSRYPINVNYYSFKLYDGETLIGDYVPCLDSSNRVAFYNKVTDSFIYPNQTSGISYILKPIDYKVDRLHESNTPLKVTIIKGSNWNNTKAIDFGGADVTFSGQTSSTNPFSNNSAITSVTNAVITNDFVYGIFEKSSLQVIDNVTFNATNGNYILNSNVNLKTANIKYDNITTAKSAWFKGCSALTDVLLSAKSLQNPNSSLASTDGMFYGCTSLKNCKADLRSLTIGKNMFNGCSSLSHVEMIVGSAHSGWTQSDFSIPSTAPCNAYRYVDDLGDGTVRLVFTNEERFKYKVTIGSADISMLTRIGIDVNLDNNNTTLTINA